MLSPMHNFLNNARNTFFHYANTEFFIFLKKILFYIKSVFEHEQLLLPNTNVNTLTKRPQDISRPCGRASNNWRNSGDQRLSDSLWRSKKPMILTNPEMSWEKPWHILRKMYIFSWIRLQKETRIWMGLKMSYISCRGLESIMLATQ